MARFDMHEAEFARMAEEFGHDAREHYARPIRRDAKVLAPKRTGELKSRIKIEEEGDAHYIGADLDYTAPQEQGARPHFISHGLGREPGVHHPGNPEVAFLKRALYRRRG